MFSSLTTKQKDELHKAILGYMKNAGMDKALAAFEKEAKMTTKPEFKDKLERKWRSILRLEKKIAELQDENRDIQDKMQSIGSEGVVNESESLPEIEKNAMEGHRQPVTCVSFHPRFNTLVSGDEDNMIMVWDSDNGTYSKKLQGHEQPVQCLKFNPSGTLLASGSADTTVKLWDFGKDMDGTFKSVKSLNGHDHTVSSVCWGSGGSVLFSGSRDKTVKMWNVETGHCTKTFETQDWVRSVSLNPDETQLVCATGHAVAVFDIATGNEITTLRDHDHDVLTVTFSSAKSDGYIIDSVLDEDDQKEAKVQQKKRVDSLEGKEDKGGMFVLSCSRDKTIRLWFVHEGVCVRTFRGHENWVRDLLFHPSGRYFISCADDCSIRVWDLKKGGRQKVRLEKAHKSFVQCIDYCRHTPMLASGGVQNTVKTWECS